jgi:hypothetical protein
MQGFIIIRKAQKADFETGGSNEQQQQAIMFLFLFLVANSFGIKSKN